MHMKVSEPPRLLSSAAGENSCCIFRVPQSFVDINGIFYDLKIKFPTLFLNVCLIYVSKIPEQQTSPTLSTLALEFFNYSLQRPDEEVAKHNNLTGRHLLDLVRTSLIPSDQKQPTTKNKPTHVIHRISKLRRAGIKLDPVKGESFLVVKFRHGVIDMPTITIDDFMTSFLLNCVAYEQCNPSCSKHFTTYATLLDYLINTTKDVEYLCDRNIIENNLGTDAEIVQFINSMGKDVEFDIDLCYFSKFFNDVHEYYHNSWHVQWASFKYTYFDTPWSFISALAALILLLLTVVQTIFTIYSFVQPQN
ncbi:hypothetical protein LWI28_028082 [Acer negundo]|uniref:Uncharacterized protein n=1 Tax=Acer negundo TaxID=4023 RepID=A0AAD5I8Q6_ACENE|nr:hypothetical protein LWI28_028082 [Acer negundo]